MESVINIDSATYQDIAASWAARGSRVPEERYGGRIAAISQALGARKLGYNVTVLEPGKRAFPFHSHRANEEMFFIIEGTGELRMGEQRRPLRAGDVIACPCGGPEVAHQIINTGATELRYLAVSTVLAPEVCLYPDSRKVGVLDFSGPVPLRHMTSEDAKLDYWEGE